MALEYSLPDDEMNDMMRRVIHRHHPRLIKADVRIGLITQRKEQDGMAVPSLKHAGWPAAATVKPTAVKDRLLGMPDVVILIDRVAWDDMEQPRQLSLLDHELTHISILDEEGAVVDVEPDGSMRAWKVDDAGRPVIKMRDHDWQAGGFREVIARWGRDAVDAYGVESVIEASGQARWEWTEKTRDIAEAGRKAFASPGETFRAGNVSVKLVREA